MCQFFSCLIDKAGKVYWDRNIDSHEELVDKFKLDGNNDDSKKWVRIEVTFIDDDIYNHKKDNWKISIDQYIIPAWYERQQSTLYEPNIWKALKQCFKEIFIIDKIDIWTSVKDGRSFIRNSKVEAYGNSTVKAYGNSTVKAYGNSTVKAYGNSTVKAYGNSTVKACDNSTVKAYGNSTVEACDNSTVKACDNSTVKAYGNSTVTRSSWSSFENIKLSGDAVYIDRKNRVILVGKKKVKF